MDDQLKARVWEVRYGGDRCDSRSFVKNVPVCHERQCNTVMPCTYSETGISLFECLVCGRTVLVETREVKGVVGGWPKSEEGDLAGSL